MITFIGGGEGEEEGDASVITDFRSTGVLFV